MDHKYDLTGQRCGDLQVLSRAPNNKFQDAYWHCICLKCGKPRIVKGSYLRRGISTSCGCNQKEVARKLRQLPDGEGAVRQLMNTYKQMARWKKKEFNLTLPQFKALTKGTCFYCGKEPSQIIRRNHNGGKTQGTPYIYNGVDRLDSSKGYTIDNCVSCCGVHNKMKLAMSPDEFLQACKAVVEYYGKGRSDSSTHPQIVDSTQLMAEVASI